MNRFFGICCSVGTVLVAALLLLLPFHALLAVWLGSTFGGYEVVRLWKEFLLLLLVPIAVYLGLAYRPLRTLYRWPVFWMIMAYAAMHLIWGIVALAQEAVTLKSFLYACIVNLRFLAFMIVCLVLASCSPWLRAHWQKLVFIPAAVVVGFGLLQAFVLPADILRHVGYGPETIPAYQAVDQKPEYARVQSTLRGPNPLGAYLVVVLAAVLAVIAAPKISARQRWFLLALAAGALVVLAFSYSRSAYIGVAIMFVAMGWFMVRSPAVKRWLLVGVAMMMGLGAAGLFILRDNNLVQNVFFHTDETSIAESSNEARWSALAGGVADVVSEPLGGGPGSAGPASQYTSQPRIAENYFLQIGQELGWIGLALFVAICLGMLATLWPLRHDILAAMLIASFLGITAIALFSHAWTDETLSLIWWGLAGIALVPAILKKVDLNRHE